MSTPCSTHSPTAAVQLVAGVHVIFLSETNESLFWVFILIVEAPSGSDYCCSSLLMADDGYCYNKLRRSFPLRAAAHYSAVGEDSAWQVCPHTNNIRGTLHSK